MKRAIGAVLAGAVALLALTGCPSDNCDKPGATKVVAGDPHLYTCEKKVGESNYHWH